MQPSNTGWGLKFDDKYTRKNKNEKTNSFILLLIAAVIINAQQSNFPKLTGPYLGQKPPGMTPEVFAPGIISTDECLEAGCAFTPDLKEFYFVRGKSMKHKPAIMVCREEKDVWTSPEVAPFSGVYFDFEPHITPDGTKMFLMRFDRSDNSVQRGLWIMERVGDGWGEPKFHGPGMYATATKDGTIYSRIPHIKHKNHLTNSP